MQQEKAVSQVASEAGRALVRKRWDRATPEQRRKQAEALAAGRVRAAARRKAEREAADHEKSEE